MKESLKKIICKIGNFFKKFWKGLIKTLKEVFTDWRTAVIFMIVFAVLSSEVWVPYLIGVICWGTELSAWMFSVGTSCWVFWAMPWTPFLPLCLGITVGIKKAFDAIKKKRNKDNGQK